MRRAQLPCVIVVGIAALACDAQLASLRHRRDPGALVVAQAADVAGLDLVRVLDSESIEVGSLLYEGLARWRPGTTEIDPGLATSWTLSDDGLRWTFELRRGVVFHDGNPLDAAAVAFSFARVIDPKHPSYVSGDDGRYWRGLLKKVKRVTAPAEARVEIEIAHPYAPLLGELAMFPIVSPAAIRRWGDEFWRHPVGTGPFAFEAWEPGEQVVVKRFDRYWGPRPALERIVFRAVIDARQRLVDLQSGSVDLAAGILPDEQSFVELHPDLRLVHMPSHDVSYLAFNLLRPPLDDRRVRRAISHAINKEPIVKLAYQGRAIAADGPLPPGQWGHRPPATRLAYDPALARQLLEDAAAAHVYDPARVFKLYAPSTPRTYLSQPERVARYIQAALSRIGIRSQLIIEPVNQLRASVGRGDHDLALFGWISDTGDPDNFLYVLFHSDNAVPGLAHNIAFYRNPTVDRLLVAAQAAIDEPSRTRLYGDVQAILTEDMPWVPLAHSELVVAARAELEGVRLSPLGHPLYAQIRRRVPR
jgi:peptide/nickel transport system substrate-binding protein